MNNQEQQEILDGLKKLSAEFFEKLPDRLIEIRQYFEKHIADKDEHVDSLFEMHRLVHALAGTAGTFGYIKIGRRLQELDSKMKELSQSFSISFSNESKNTILHELASIGDVIRMLRSQ